MKNTKNNKSPTEFTTVVPRVPNKYIKIPKEIILEKDLSEHRISTFIYLNYNQTWDEKVHYSPTYMIRWCGYKANWRKGKRENIYDKFLNCMNWFHKNGYLLDFDAAAYIQNNFQSSLLNMEKLLPEGNFALLYDFEIEAILEYQSSYRPLNKSILLLVLSYIKAFTWTRWSSTTGHSDKSKKNKPEIFHSQFELMEPWIGVKARLISKATKVLEELNLIKTYRMPSYQDHEGVWHTDDLICLFPYKIVSTNKVFRLCEKDEYDWEKELSNGIKYLKNLNYTSKKFYQE